MSLIAHNLFELTQECARCDTEEALRRIFQQIVPLFLPHTGALLLVGRRREALIQIDYSISIGYGIEATRNALTVSSISQRKALQHWFVTGLPLVIELPADAHLVSPQEASEIEALGLGRIAAHGVLDPARQLGSYMTYSGVAEMPKQAILEKLQFITPAIHQALMNVLAKVDAISALELSPAERELIEWVAAGKTNVEIAELRHRSVNTVRNQLAALFVKLGVSNRAEAVARVRDIPTRMRSK